ncbi:MAG: putative transport system permease protein, partial [Gaiellaceae bacterium]|nr:putative transport system permease protein [Gaiellaceae bacterium]
MTTLALRGLVRAPANSLARVLVLAAAVALLGSMLIFIGNSLRTMTQSSVRSVPLDWQGPVSSYGAAVKVATGVAKQPGVLEAAPVATAPFSGAAHKASVGEIRSSAGAILAVPPGYQAHIKTFRFLHGALRPGSIVLDQQLAATLQAGIGDRIALTPRPGASPVSLPVSGIAVVTSPDVLFQPLNPLAGPAAAQPPANVAIMPIETFAHRVAPLLPP